MLKELQLRDAEFPTDRHLGIVVTDMTGFEDKPVHTVICVRSHYRDNWITLNAASMRRLRDWLDTVLKEGGESEDPPERKTEAPEG